MNLTKIFRFAVVSFAAALGFASPSQAAVTGAFFSAGATCAGAASASFSTSGPAVQVSLCMTTTAPTATCGHTIVLQSAAGESGRFVVVSPVTLGSGYSDPNSEVSPVPLSINTPPIVADFGGTSSAPVAAASNQLLATFNLAPQANATNASYVISLNSVSTVAVDADGTCGATTVPTEAPITATFTLNRNNAPVFTSPASVTFTTTGNNTFTPTATGNPTPTITQSGTLPAGVTFSGGSLTGTPGSAGTFNITFTATNGAGSTMQPFVLTTTTGAASQTITFNNPGTQTFSSSPVALTATATSGLPVTFVSTTLNVCSVSGSSVTMLTLGTCTITASQAGGSGFSAAPNVSQSFGIAGTVPGAPTIGTGTPGDGQATIAFTAPSSTGGAAISSYTVNCGGVSKSGTGSPITVTPLSNGTLYTCSVSATNIFGTGPSSASVSVTPSGATPLTLIGVQSRKTHGAVGTFDVPINFATPLAGAVSVEPRTALAGAHTIVFQFSGTITAAGTADSRDAGNAVVGSVSTSFAGNEVTVTVNGVPDNKRITVSLSNVNGAGVNASASIGFLVGDVNGSRTVTSADILQVKGRSGLTTDASNFLYDLNASGSITSADILQVKGRSGLVIP